MQLNCKVMKMWQPSHFYINPPPFQDYSPFLAKFLVPPPLPQVTQFLEGPTPAPPPLIKGGGVPKQVSVYLIKSK